MTQLSERDQEVVNWLKGQSGYCDQVQDAMGFLSEAGTSAVSLNPRDVAETHRVERMYLDEAVAIIERLATERAPDLKIDVVSPAKEPPSGEPPQWVLASTHRVLKDRCEEYGALLARIARVIKRPDLSYQDLPDHVQMLYGNYCQKLERLVQLTTARDNARAQLEEGLRALALTTDAATAP